MRFVDLTVNKIQCVGQCFDTKVEFSCTHLSVGIAQVLLQQNLLHLNVTATSLRGHVRELAHVALDDDLNDRNPNKGGFGADGIITNGLYCNFPRMGTVLDVQLHERTVVGCKLYGSHDDIINMQVCTSFLDFAARKHQELITSGFLRASSSSSSAAAAATADAAHHAMRTANQLEKCLEAADLHLRLVVVNQDDDVGGLPLQFCAEILKMQVVSKPWSEDQAQHHQQQQDGDDGDLEADDNNDDDDDGHPRHAHRPPRVRSSRRLVLTSGVVHNVSARTGHDFHQDFISLSSIQVGINIRFCRVLESLLTRDFVCVGGVGDGVETHGRRGQAGVPNGRTGRGAESAHRAVLPVARSHPRPRDRHHDRVQATVAVGVERRRP